MKLKIVHSTENCNDSTCPTIYQDETSGSFVIQGFILAPETKAKILIPNGEDVVVVPKEFLKKFLEGFSQIV